MEEKYLPIGSIVNLKSSDKKIMIIGYYSVEYNDMIEVYDYIGCLYPEGLLLKNNLISFNHEDITTCLFKGYKDDSFNIMNKKFLNEEDIPKESDYQEEKSSPDLLEIIDDVPNSIFDSIEPETLDDDIVAKTDAQVNELIANDEIKEKLKKEEFIMPHYRFDENGIIISE